jgi:hypothetical protein
MPHVPRDRQSRRVEEMPFGLSMEPPTSQRSVPFRNYRARTPSRSDLGQTTIPRLMLLPGPVVEDIAVAKVPMVAGGDFHTIALCD